MYFSDYKEDSRVWLFQSQRPLTTIEQSEIQKKLNTFLSSWATHGSAIFAKGEIIEDYFIVIAADESKIAASGCSIDTLTRFMKELERDFSLSLFDRLHVLCEVDDVKKIVHFSDLTELQKAFVYNPMIQTLKELRENWKVPAASLS